MEAKEDEVRSERREATSSVSPAADSFPSMGSYGKGTVWKDYREEEAERGTSHRIAGFNYTAQTQWVWGWAR